MFKKLFFLLTVYLFISCSSTKSLNRSPQSQLKEISIIGLADFHGELEKAPLITSYINKIKSETQGPTFIVDGGDLFQGTIESNYFEGRPVIELYNYWGVVAAALGNHEFDFGPIGRHKAVPLEKEDKFGRGAFLERIKEANFPFLAANVFDLEEKETPDWLSSYRIYQDPIWKVKIGVVGTAGADTTRTTAQANLGNLCFEETTPHVIKAAKKARDKGADFVVYTTHSSGKSNFKLTEKYPSGLINVVVAAHDHRGFANIHSYDDGKKIAVIQPYSSGSHLSWIKLSYPDFKIIGPFDQKGKLVGPIPIKDEYKGKKITPDSETENLLAPYINSLEVKKLKSLKSILKIDQNLDKNFTGESSMGNFVTDLFLKAYPEADFALYNSGGLRRTLEKTNRLSYQAIFEAFPFESRVMEVELTGSEIIKLIKRGWQQDEKFLWSGLLIRTDKNCKIIAIDKKTNKKLAPDSIYKIVTTDYLSGGGSGVEGTNFVSNKESLNRTLIEKHFHPIGLLNTEQDGVYLRHILFASALEFGGSYKKTNLSKKRQYISHYCSKKWPRLKEKEVSNCIQPPTFD